MDQIPRPLTDRERAIVDFERTWWVDAGCSKEQAIRDRLGLSAARYYEVLSALLDVRAAMDYDPLVIRRRRRSRDDRRRARFEGPSGPQSGKQGPSGPQSGKQGPSGPQSGKQGPSGPQSGKQGPSGPQTGRRGHSAGPSAR